MKGKGLAGDYADSIRVIPVIVSLLLCAWSPNAASAQQAPAPPSPRQLFDQSCVTCHGNTAVERAADPSVLRRMTPERIYESLTTGVMRVQAQELDDAARRAIAEYLGDRKLGAGEIGDAKLMPNRCEASPGLLGLATAPAWNGWGADPANTRFQPQQGAGLVSTLVPRLRLQWAFAFPGASAVYGQPTIAADRVFVGADTGYVYSLDRTSGCVHWSFQAQAGVRSAVTVGPVASSARMAAYFGDMKGNVYAVDATTGEQIWKVSVDEHALTRITAAPVLYRTRLYVSVGSFEEGAATSSRYPCCTFRGSVVALGTDTGRQIWKTFTITDSPKPTRLSATGTQQFGPSGGSVWSSPTIDAQRNALYVGTGNAFSRPVAPTTDAIMAFDLDTGKVLWVTQALADDVWLPGCPPGSSAGNCPEKMGPDYDFGASPILTRLPSGQRLLVSVQKSGQIWAHDPDRNGAVVWKTTHTGTPPTAEGEMVWGAAVDGRNVYVGLTSGGIAAHALATGKQEWLTRILPSTGRRGGHSGAVSAIPGMVFSGGWDGVLRAVSTDGGKVAWEYDTMRAFDTVNRVPARGGSMGAPGPTIAGGMVFVGSGYIGVRNGTPGNVLLAFGVE
jgi:polyvinyl alcohol dehydrogenase (cytochrome)